MNLDIALSKVTMESTLLYPRLLGDVGGTNARFGWQAHAQATLENIQTLSCAAFPSLANAMASYLEQSRLPQPAAACIGIATPITGDQVNMTNHHWSFSIKRLQQELSLQHLRVINDFTALALALPGLMPEQKTQIGGSHSAIQRAPIGLIGAGTGLGVSGLLPVGQQGWVPITGEGGHVTLSANTLEEFRVIEFITHRYGHASAERILSGQGLVDLHEARSLAAGMAFGPELHAAEISHRGLHAGDRHCLKTLDMFAGFLGSVAGDLALTLGARAGIYIGGGIVPRWLGWFEQSSFRQRFESKGRFRGYLQDIPVWVIQSAESPALWGAALALDNP